MLNAASENLGSLHDYAVNQSKWNALSAKLDAFDALQSRPCQNRATKRSATRQLSLFFRRTDTVLKRGFMRRSWNLGNYHEPGPLTSLSASLKRLAAMMPALPGRSCWDRLKPSSEIAQPVFC